MLPEALDRIEFELEASDSYVGDKDVVEVDMDPSGFSVVSYVTYFHPPFFSSVMIPTLCSAGT